MSKEIFIYMHCKKCCQAYGNQILLKRGGGDLAYILELIKLEIERVIILVSISIVASMGGLGDLCDLCLSKNSIFGEDKLFGKKVERRMLLQILENHMELYLKYYKIENLGGKE